MCCSATVENNVDTWYLDSGCSNHMTRNIDMFASLDKSVKTDVILRNGNKVSIEGKGHINIVTKTRDKKYIQDVFYVPGLQHNLMSLGQMVGNGHTIDFAKNVCTIMDKCNNKRVLAKVKMMENRMFPLNIPHKRNLFQNANTQCVLQVEEKNAN